MATSIWNPGVSIQTAIGSGTATQKFNLNAGQTVINLTNFTYEVGTNALKVFLNGVLQVLSADYLETSSSSITLTSGANAGDTAELLGIIGLTNIPSPDASTTEVDVAAATTTDIGAANSNVVRIVGTGTINSFGTNFNGPVFIRFTSDVTIVAGVTMVTPLGTNLAVGAGYTCIAVPKATNGVSDGWVISDLNAQLFFPAGTSVSRSVQGKLRDLVSVKDFGAVGNGLTNDRAAFQAAVDYLTSQGGGAIQVPSGVYSISGSAVTISGNNITIFTEGYAKILKGANINLFTLSGNNNEIKGLTIDGQGNGGACIYITGDDNTVWFNKISNNLGPGIGQNGRLATARGNTIVFNSVSGITGNSGISTNAAEYALVAFNRVADISTEGIANNQAYRCMYLANTVTDSGGVGGIGTDAADQNIWALNLSYANGRGFKAKEHNGGSNKDILALNIFANNTNEGISLENNVTPAGQSGTYVIAANVATITITAGHMRSVGETLHLVFSGAAPDGDYVVTAVISPTVLTVTVVTADESGTLTLGVVDPAGNYGKDWVIIGNITTGNGANNIDIQAKTVGGAEQNHLITGNVTPENKVSAYGETLEVSNGPVAFDVRNLAGQSNVTGNSTIAALTWDTVYQNLGAGFNLATDIFIAPHPGRYLFSLSVRMLSTTGATLGAVRLTVADPLGSITNRIYEAPLVAALTTELRGFVTCVVYLDKGWTITPAVRVTGLAGDTADVSADDTLTWFTGSAV